MYPAFVRIRIPAAISVAILLVLIALASPARANLPGGIVGSGTGANVTITTSGGNVTMANGIVTAVIDIATSQILQLTYDGKQVTDGGTAANSAFYWQGQNSVGEQTGADGILSVVTDPSTNGGNSAEIMISDIYTNHTATTDSPDDAYRHFAMFRGSPGIYVTQVMSRPSTYPAGGADIPSFTCKLGSNIFNWLAQDAAGQNTLMPTDSTTPWTAGINFSPKEVTRITSGLLDGWFDCKYDYAGDLGLLSVTGWCSNNQTSNMGLWCIRPSTEFNSCGPKHPEILSQILLINVTFKGVHFGFGSDLSFAADEPWTLVCGPIFLYFNKVPTGAANAQVPLYADAVAQAAAEKGAWPYSWFTDSHYVPASGRGSVTGALVISDTGNPVASASNMWVGVARQPSSTLSPVPTDFQTWSKNYQFWTRTDANGNFTIPNVIAGSNYTFFAFGPGAIGQFQSQALAGATNPFTVTTPTTPFSVTVTGGSATHLGAVTWAPARVGATVWEIGVPDRDTTEFRHGQDYWHGDEGTAANPAVNWAPWLGYGTDFPNGLTYTVGQSIWSRDWNYAQPTLLDPTTGSENGTTQTIVFNLPKAPAAGVPASLYFAICGDYSGPVIVTVNGTNVTSPSSGFFPGFSSDDPMIRMESHGIWCDYRLNFASTALKVGQNQIQLNMRKGGYFSDGILYDYIRLELGGYVPPAPASLTAMAGNAQNVLNWPPAPGAVTYNVLRSTTSGADYSLLAGNVTGPVCGSTPLPAAYIDTTASNGTSYYYVVQAVNPNGSSANSPQAAGTATAGAPGIPAAPAGLTASAGNDQAVLSWTGSPGAAYYNVLRSLTTGGPYTVVDSSVSGANCTDTGLRNSLNYYYVVSAVNASGAGANSSEASVLPVPPALTATPTNLTAAISSGSPFLSWTGPGAATNYVIQRATSIGGPYTVLYNSDMFTYYPDTTAAGNTTYYYEVAGANLSGKSSFTSPAGITTPPAAPAALTATPGNTQVQLVWTPSTAATSYVVQRGTATGVYTNSFTASGPSYVDAGLTNGTTYYYVVSASDSNGAGLSSAEASATPLATLPLAPVSLTGTAGNAQVTLGWTAVAGTNSYIVRRAQTSGGPYANLTTTLTGASYTNTGLTNGTTYYYVVAAANTTGTGANSNQVSAEPLPPLPAAPTGLTGTAGNAQVSLSWSAVSGATGYVLGRGASNGGPYATTGTSSAPAYIDTGLTNGQTYYYVVAGSNVAGAGSNSSQFAATPVQNFSQWIAAAYPGVTATNVIGATANPNNGPYDNLLEYFFGLQPGSVAPANVIASASDGAGHLLLNFRLAKNLAGVTYSIQQSSNLVTWTDAGVTSAVVSTQSTYYQMQAAVPLPSGSQPLFLRLSVAVGP